MQHRVWAEINLEHLESNCRRLSSLVGGSSKLMVVCKANAYGHGVKHIVAAAQKTGITRLAVGDSHEALELRELGWEHQILVLGSLIEEEVISVIHHNIAIAVHSLERVRFLDELTKQLDKDLEVHLKVDTGMARFGTNIEIVSDIASILKKSKHLKWRGLMTHFANFRDQQKMDQQIQAFDNVIKSLQPLPKDVCVHAASTQSVINAPEAHYDFVRCGFGVYGLSDDQHFKRVLSLFSQIIFIKDVSVGTEVGYFGEFTCERPTRLAIIPVGYSDGLRFSFSNKGYCLIKGQKAPFVGRISMDYTTVDITDIPDVQVGDKVTLIGQDKEQHICIDDWKQWAQTTAYEITCLLGKRIQRVATY